MDPERDVLWTARDRRRYSLRRWLTLFGVVLVGVCGWPMTKASADPDRGLIDMGWILVVGVAVAVPAGIALWIWDRRRVLDVHADHADHADHELHLGLVNGRVVHLDPAAVRQIRMTWRLSSCGSFGNAKLRLVTDQLLGYHGRYDLIDTGRLQPLIARWEQRCPGIEVTVKTLTPHSVRESTE
ncbi:hypothetical protein QBC31_39675 [Streptomyces sp. B21-079]|uniref:hypothetical protein n=1 Tax=Streptomyces sp. B21-079 TaxID=3039409 RepID=UPI002FF19667